MKFVEDIELQEEVDEEEEDRVLDELNDKDVLLEDDEVEMRHEDEMLEKLEDDDCDLDEEKQLEEELY